MPEYPHLLYTNSPSKTNGFKKKRGRDPDKEKQKPEPTPPISEEKKRFLVAKLSAYTSAVAERIRKKTLPIPANIDLNQIDFYATFDKKLIASLLVRRPFWRRGKDFFQRSEYFLQYLWSSFRCRQPFCGNCNALLWKINYPRS